jgi:hypothetical protein
MAKTVLLILVDITNYIHEKKSQHSMAKCPCYYIHMYTKCLVFSLNIKHVNCTDEMISQ